MDSWVSTHQRKPWKGWKKLRLRSIEPRFILSNGQVDASKSELLGSCKSHCRSSGPMDFFPIYNLQTFINSFLGQCLISYSINLPCQCDINLSCQCVRTHLKLLKWHLLCLDNLRTSPEISKACWKESFASSKRCRPSRALPRLFHAAGSVGSSCLSVGNWWNHSVPKGEWNPSYVFLKNE